MQLLCADIDGIGLHAAVRCEANERKRLEQLCCYITRPAKSYERVQCNAAWQVELKLETPWCDDTMHLMMSPLAFMQRLVALVQHVAEKKVTDDRFTAVNLGSRMPGWGRGLPVAQRSCSRSAAARPAASGE